MLKQRGFIAVPPADNTSDSFQRRNHAFPGAGRGRGKSDSSTPGGQGTRPPGGLTDLRERVWWHFRAHRTADINDLLSTYAKASEKSAYNSLKKYLNVLEQIEILERCPLRPFAKTGRRPIRWRLAVDIGPKVPVWLPNKHMVYDLNSNTAYSIGDSGSLVNFGLQALRKQIDDALFQPPNDAGRTNDYWTNVGQVYRWLSGGAVSDQVLSTAKPISIKLPKFNPQEIVWLKFAHQACSPADLRLSVGSWTLSAIANLKGKGADSSVSLRVVSHLIGLLGFNAPKSHYQIWRRGQLSWRWSVVSYPKICDAAVTRDALIYFADISYVSFDGDILGEATSADEMPADEISAEFHGFSMVSALSPSGDFRFMVNNGIATDQIVLVFLARLLRSSNNPVFLVVDDNSMYRTNDIKSFVKAQQGRLRLFFAPSQVSG